MQFQAVSARYGNHKKQEHSDPMPWSGLTSAAADVGSDTLTAQEMERVTPAVAKVFCNSKGDASSNPYLARGGNLVPMKRLPNPPVSKWRSIHGYMRMGAVAPIPVRARQWTRGVCSARSGGGLGSGGSGTHVVRTTWQRNGITFVRKLFSTCKKLPIK